MIEALVAVLAPLAVGVTVPLPATGQTACLNDGNAPVPCAGTGQDGETRHGQPSPVPRFVDKGDGTVTDELTGLTWLRDGNCWNVNHTWAQGLVAIKDLNANPAATTCGGYVGHYSDWRMPNVNELFSLVNFGVDDSSTWLGQQGFVHIGGARYLTSTTQSYYPLARLPYKFLSVVLYSGVISDFFARDDQVPATTWAVRGSSSGPASVLRTGQQTCYDAQGLKVSCTGTGQDGEIQAGAEWPSPRFQPSDDGTVVDRLTGLTWLADAACPKSTMASPDGRMNWGEALAFVRAINAGTVSLAACGYAGSQRDWRLPNVLELWSLANAGERFNAAWLKGQGFRNALGVTTPPEINYYWASTRWRSLPDPHAYVVGLEGGFEIPLGGSMRALGGPVAVAATNNRLLVWPVRGLSGTPPPPPPDAPFEPRDVAADGDTTDAAAFTGAEASSGPDISAPAPVDAPIEVPPEAPSDAGGFDAGDGAGEVRAQSRGCSCDVNGGRVRPLGAPTCFVLVGAFGVALARRWRRRCFHTLLRR